MSGQRLFLSLTTVLICSLQSYGLQPEGSESLLSPQNAATFSDIARELYLYSDIRSPEAQQAEVFLMAALALDERAVDIQPEIINFASKYPDRDYYELVILALQRYVDKDFNMETARQAVRYLLERKGSLEQRVSVLQNLIKTLGKRNDFFASELATEIALLSTEKANYPPARALLWQAYLANPYNELAFAKFNELLNKELEPAVYLRYFRMALRARPLDIKAALEYAGYTESLGLYEHAMNAYEYSAELFRYLHPSEPLPSAIYLPWIRSCYNADGKQSKCLQIAKDARKSGTFDLFLEAITAQAALKIGDTEEAARIFESLDSTAEKQLGLRSAASQKHPEQWAWFYCFAKPDPEKALAWANEAYASDPNSPMTTAILAYSLVMNQYPDLAEPFVKDSQKQNQIAALTMALIQLSREQKAAALETLKAAIAMDPGSLEARRAKQLLRENGSDYIPAYDPAIILNKMEEEFDKTIVPKFTPAEKILSLKLGTVGGTEISYGNKINADFVIENKGSEPFVIGDHGIIKGNIRIDAEVTGDVNAKIPNLQFFRFVPSGPVEPGQVVFIPLHINTGRFRELLRSFPQAAIEIKLSGYIDPVVDANGTLTNYYPDVKAAELTIRRRPVQLNSRYLQSRLESLNKGRQGQKIISAKLFAGLLREQNAMQQNLVNYEYSQTEPSLLDSALSRVLTDSDWTVKLQSTAELTDVPLDYELTNALAGNLNDEYWPVRLITLFVLGRSQGVGFEKVLNWTAENDTFSVFFVLLWFEKEEATAPQPLISSMITIIPAILFFMEFPLYY